MALNSYTKAKYNLICIVIAIVASTVTGYADNGGINQQRYENYSTLPANKLLSMGAEWLKSEATLDSALTVLTIVSNREMDSRADMLIKAKSLNDLGYLYTYYYYDYKEAYKTLQQAEEICEHYNFNTLKPLVELNLANLIYNSNRLYYTMEIDESLDMYKKAMLHSISAGEKRLLTMIIANIIDIAFTNDCTDMVIDIIEKYRKVDIPDDIPLKRFVNGYIDGILAYRAGDYDNAVRAARNIRTLAENDEARNRHIINSYILESRAQAKKGDIESALKLCNEAFMFAEQIGDKDVIMALHKELEDIYLITGDEEQAKHHHYKYLMQKDSILNDFQMGKVHKMKFRHELDKMNGTVKELELKDHMRRKTILWMTIAIILLTLLIVILVYFQKTLRKKNRHLYRSYQEILKNENRTITHGGTVTDTTIVPDNKEENIRTTTKYKSSVLDDEMKNALWGNIVQVMETSPEIYTQGFSASELAELAGGIELAHLSQVIGEMSGSNFYNLLCKYRIMEACRIMNSDKAQSWTVEGISIQTGFKSRSNFSTNFKKIVGMTPAQYMKEARKNDPE